LEYFFKNFILFLKIKKKYFFKLAEDERAMLLYQLILRLDRTEFHKSVLTVNK